jgi:ATP-binding cassette, subfamily F, member 3
MLFQDLDLAIQAGDRVCVVGPNGRGKTTLLKVLAGQLEFGGGELSYHPAVVHGFYEQTNIQTLNDLNTVETEILNCHPEVDRQQARNIAGAMLFEGDAALKKISVLSGGEKARVMLGKLLATPVNLLLLDEPSNHLDMESCDALVAAVDNFDGAVIMVTHNEMFLHALAQRLIVFEQDRVTVFEGTYQEFLDKGGWGDEASAASPTKSLNPSKAVSPQVSKKELRQQRSAIIGERSRRLKPINRAIEKTENTIEIEETRLETLNQEMVQASQDQDGQRIAELSPLIRQCQESIDALFSELENLYTEKEKVEVESEVQLKALDG